MGKKPDLKETILNVAGALFAQQGYAATSIKQIAQGAGCTTAALYYYFEEGKAHILREVVRSYSTDVLSTLDEDGDFDDLPTYLDHLAQRVGQTMPKMTQRMNWLALELPNLPAEEQEQFANHFFGLHQTIRDRLVHHFKDRERASMLAWVIVCAFMGYGQLFQIFGFNDRSVPSLDDFGQALVAMIRQTE